MQSKSPKQINEKYPLIKISSFTTKQLDKLTAYCKENDIEAYFYQQWSSSNFFFLFSAFFSFFTHLSSSLFLSAFFIKDWSSLYNAKNHQNTQKWPPLFSTRIGPPLSISFLKAISKTRAVSKDYSIKCIHLLLYEKTSNS